jgi:hypothetical protein
VSEAANSGHASSSWGAQAAPRKAGILVGAIPVLGAFAQWARGLYTLGPRSFIERSGELW